jgi:hypothetical protein
MAFGLDALVNNITDSVSGLVNGLLGKSNETKPYPDADTRISIALNQITPSNWLKSIPYAFSVQSASGQDDFVANLFSDFVLPLNPSDIAQDENFSINIRPTQGGSVVQHSGIRYRDLIISGTTGIAPFRGAGGVQKSNGKAIFQPDALKYKSGYEVFLTLRNWFKAYYQVKTTNNDLILVFKNFKDGEFLIIELNKFQMKRSASRKTLYDYTISCRVLGNVAFQEPAGAKGFYADIDSFVDQAKEGLDTARGGLLRSQQILRQVEATYESTVLDPLRKAILAIKAFKGLGTVAADLGRQAISNTVSEAATLGVLLGISKQSSLTASDQAEVKKALTSAQNNSRVGASSPTTANAVASLLNTSDILTRVDSSVLPKASQDALKAELAAAAALPRSFYEETLNTLTRVRDNAVDKFGLGSPVYDAQFGRVSTGTVNSQAATEDEILLVDAFSKAIKAMEKVLSANNFHGTSYSDLITDVQSKFTENLGLKIQPAMKSIILPTDTDLERLALQQLGNSSRWVEIAELNGLKPPFIIQDQSDTTLNVLHPGQQILIPEPVQNGFGTLVSGKPTYYTDNLSQIEKNLGVDLMIDENFDLVLSNNNDLELAVGAKNAAQAIALKLAYEPGDLIKHPSVGVGITVGEKFPDLNDIQINLVKSLTQDPRFQSVQNLSIQQDGSSLLLNFEVKITNVDIPVPLSIRI